jgi:hypothetical protein
MWKMEKGTGDTGTNGSVKLVQERKGQMELTYDLILQELTKLGISAFPPPTSKDRQAWSTISEQMNVLKTIESLVARRKNVLAEVMHQTENRIVPVSSRTRAQEMFLSQLATERGALSSKITEAQEKLIDVKAARTEMLISQQLEMESVDRRIEELSRSVGLKVC